MIAAIQALPAAYAVSTLLTLGPVSNLPQKVNDTLSAGTVVTLGSTATAPLTYNASGLLDSLTLATDLFWSTPGPTVGDLTGLAGVGSAATTPDILSALGVSSPLPDQYNAAELLSLLLQENSTAQSTTTTAAATLSTHATGTESTTSAAVSALAALAVPETSGSPSTGARLVDSALEQTSRLLETPKQLADTTQALTVQQEATFSVIAATTTVPLAAQGDLPNATFTATPPAGDSALQSPMDSLPQTVTAVSPDNVASTTTTEIDALTASQVWARKLASDLNDAIIEQNAANATAAINPETQQLQTDRTLQALESQLTGDTVTAPPASGTTTNAVLDVKATTQPSMTDRVAASTPAVRTGTPETISTTNSASTTASPETAANSANPMLLNSAAAAQANISGNPVYASAVATFYVNTAHLLAKEAAGAEAEAADIVPPVSAVQRVNAVDEYAA